MQHSSLHARRGAAATVRRPRRCVGCRCIPHSPLEALLLLYASAAHTGQAQPSAAHHMQRATRLPRQLVLGPVAGAASPAEVTFLVASTLKHFVQAAASRRRDMYEWAYARKAGRAADAHLHVLDGFWKMASGSALACAYRTGASASLWSGALGQHKENRGATLRRHEPASPRRHWLAWPLCRVLVTAGNWETLSAAVAAWG